MIAAQNKHPNDLKNPSKRNSNIYPNNLITQPKRPNKQNPKIPKIIIPIAVNIIYEFYYNINIVLIFKNSNII